MNGLFVSSAIGVQLEEPADHIVIDGADHAPGIILCKWCFDVPFPPWWTSHSRTEHFLGNMKLLPDVLLHDGPCVSLIAEYLFEGR